MRHGLPYQGSKNKLAKRIVDLLPPAQHFYDLFAGGCAISHAALLSGKFGCVHFSDTNDSVVLFRDCLEGNIPDGSEWISREEFEKRKDVDPYVRIIWSFGNNQRNYLYSREIEPYKKAVHEMIFAPTPNERRLKFREVCKLMPSVMGGGEQAATNQQNDARDCIPPSVSRAITPPRKISAMQAFENHRRVFGVASKWKDGGGSRLQSEECRQQLNAPFCSGEYEMRIADYRDIEILPDSVIYCDIPYKGTAGYRNVKFDYEAFFDWCGKQSQPLFISEYSMPEDRFVCVAEFERTSTFSSTNNAKKVVEKIFRPKHQIDFK